MAAAIASTSCSSSRPAPWALRAAQTACPAAWQPVHARSAARQPGRRVQRLSVAQADGSSPAASSSSQEQGRRVVVAVDASEDAMAAFNWVLRNVYRSGDELHLLHVVPDVFQSPASGSIYYCSSPDPETERALWEQTKEFFQDNFLAHAKAVGIEDACWLHLVKERRHMPIGRAVCKKAEELEAEPLVLAAHDKGPLETLLLGSISKYCVAHSKRPVLLLHPNHSQL